MRPTFNIKCNVKSFFKFQFKINLIIHSQMKYHEPNEGDQLGKEHRYILDVAGQIDVGDG